MNEHHPCSVAAPDQRKALLKRECAGQSDLRSPIDRLLKAHFKCHPLLDQPASSEDRRRGRVHFLECAVLIAVGLLAFELAWHYPSSRQASSWREEDWPVWHQAHQLFQREPEELCESELEDVGQWIRCLGLLERYLETGSDSLTDAECELFVETLEKLSPNLHEYANRFLPVYEACRRRLADATSGPACPVNTSEEQP